MSTTLKQPFPRLHSLPAALPIDGAIHMELREGVPIFRTSASVQGRIETLLDKQRHAELAEEELEELDQYEEMDDYLSFLNRVVRNRLHAEPPQGA